MPLRLLSIASLLLFALSLPAMAEPPLSRGDVWGTRASDNDYASHRSAQHSRMDREGVSSENDRNSDRLWRDNDSESASVRRHSKNKKKARKSSGASSNSSRPFSGNSARALNE